MNTANCSHCGNGFEKKNKKHRFCSSTCRKLNHRKIRGIQEPEFLSGGTYTPKPKKQAPEPSISAIRAQDMQAWQITPNDYQIAHLEYNLRYWQNVKENAMRNQIPLTYVGAGIGAIAGKNIGEKIGYGIMGTIIGKILDGDEEKKRTAKQRTILRAEQEIRSIRQQIRLEKEAKSAKPILKKMGILLEQEKGVYTVSPDVVTKVTAENYRSENIPSLKFGGAFGYLLGNPGKNFYTVIYGGPGSRKSTFCLRFANYFSSEHGKVLYITREQAGQSKSFQQLLEMNNCKGFEIDRGQGTHDKISLDYLRKAVKGYDLVILDSVNYMKLKAEEIETLRAENKELAILAIMQSTKDGQMKGGQEFKHDCETLIKADGISYEIDGKNRYGSSNEKIAVDSVY